MSPSTPEQEGRPTDSRSVAEIVRRNATSSLMEGVVMLVIAAYLASSQGGLPEVPPNAEAGDYALISAVWGFWGGGAAMLVVALLSYVGWRHAPLLDSLASAVLGLLFVIAGMVIVVAGSMFGLLIAVFGLMSLHAARTSWGAHRSVRALAGPASPPQATDPGAGRSMPGTGSGRTTTAGGASPRRKPDEPPPPEGFLAELGEDDEEA